MQIVLPDGKVTTSDSENVNRTLSDFFGRKVELAQVAPEDFTIDQFHPDMDGLDPRGNRNVTIEQKLGSALFESMGVDSPLPPGSFLDVFPVSIITTSSLDHMQALRPETNFDVKRFRMNVVVESEQAGFLENEWIRKSIKLGKHVRLLIKMLVPRCVMTTLPQEGIPKDNHVLRTLADHNRLDIMGSGKFPCAGVYAVVGASGKVRLGDAVKID